jgi:hypothetical protein
MADGKQQPAKDGKATAREPSDKTMPPAGPHAKPELTDKEKTAGSGVLPDPARKPKSTEAPTG